MIPPRVFLTLGVLALLPTPLLANLKVYPPELTFQNSRVARSILVVEETAGRTTAERTAEANLTSTNPAVITVTPTGQVTPVADGKAEVLARVGEQKVRIPVTVSGLAQPRVPGFLNHVQAILTRAGCNSGACHGALAGKGGLKLSLRGYDPEADHFVLTRQARGRRLDPANPEASLLLAKSTRTLPHGGGRRINEGDDDYNTLLQWIQQGAPGLSTKEPTLERLEVFPPRPLLKPQQEFRVLVLGHYSDGHVEELTRWARFTSTLDDVAQVDEAGHVTVMAQGVASIVVNFGTHLSTLTLAVPFANQADSQPSPAPEAKNVVDRHVTQQLRELGIPASPTCTDGEFLRRVSLDLCGKLPAPEELQAFLADPHPEKRARKIDELLSRSAYVDTWTHKWSDLLLVSSRKLSQPAMWAYYQSVRQAVAENRPWDQFARDVLTAKGSTLINGYTNYFILHKDVTDLVETTAVTFLGMSINCARCHNHPLERWTQDEYWATANLFSRVGLKNGDRGGEVLVQALAEGEAFHPRRGVAMPPAPLDGPAWPLSETRDRREHFVNWLTAKDNPYFARALVNRVWASLFGRGLVDPEDDLRESNPATNPPLMDALVESFIASGYDVKQLIRTIANSQTYQRSSTPLPGNVADDRFYSRATVRRLPAEVILDAYSDVTGVPTEFTEVTLGPSGGTNKTTSYPPGTRALQLPDALLVSQFLDTFGRAERLQTCSCERTSDASVGQALHLNNGQTLNQKLRHEKSRLTQWLQAGLSNEAIVEKVYLQALSRLPTAKERERFAKLLPPPTEESTARRESLEDFLWAVLTSPDFLYNR